MKSYEKYKDSGVEWIGEIPSHWEESKMKHEFTFSGGGTPSTENDDYWGGSIPWVSSKDMKSRYIYETTDYITELGLKNSSCSMIEPNSLIIVVRSGILQRTIPVSINRVPLVVNQDQKVLRSRRNLSVEYLYYFITGNERHLLVDWMKEGTTVESIEMEYLSRFQIFVPPLPEQHQIVSFLDEKTSLIDDLINKKEQKIGLLKEYRTSLINRVITNGLNPDCPMKDSGVEWIGMIPSHWDVKPLKRVVSENQSSLGSNTPDDYELDYVEISDLDSSGRISNTTHYLFSDSPSRCRRVLSKGDVFISCVRTYLRAIGIVEDDVENLICSTGFSVLTPNDSIVSKYLFYSLRTEWFISDVVSQSEGVSYPSIQSEKLLSIRIVQPPLSEQEQIVSFLDEKTGEIDRTIQSEQKKIELLKEYRQSLISSLITGKIKVVN